MKIKNYRWDGFGFPVVFSELPAVKLRGEIVPDIDLSQFAAPLIEIICAEQSIPLSGNQVKLIRNHLNLSLREFAKFMGVTHQSVMRWEKQNKQAARMDVSTEIVLRLKVLRALKSSPHAVRAVLKKTEDLEELKPTPDYTRRFKPIRITGT